jgi:hypothetical protein
VTKTKRYNEGYMIWRVSKLLDEKGNRNYAYPEANVLDVVVSKHLQLRKF